MLSTIIYLLVFTLTAVQAAGPPAGTVITQCSQPGVIALTFDDGPYIYEDQLVDELNAAGAKATFFVTGTLYGNIYNHTASLQHAFSSGHQIGSHTWTHTDLSTLTADQIRNNEMIPVEQALETILGVKPTYMRPPYGSVGGQVVPTLRDMGYRIVNWDIDSGDWAGLTPAQSEARITSAGTGGNGHIILMHEPLPTTVNELAPWVMNYAKSNNLKMVTVAECLGDPNGAYA
ncbi:chitin deacetylase-like protein [Thermoascus aurantiacus ATCC 26904]